MAAFRLRPTYVRACIASVWLLCGTVQAQTAAAPGSAHTASAVPPFSTMELGRVGPPWRFATLPRKAFTNFEVVDLDGQRVLKVHSPASYGHLVIRLAPSTPPSTQLRWRWQVAQLVKNANLRQRAGDDAALKLCIAFDFDQRQLGWSERTKLHLAQVSTGELIPAQTLCYVWDNQLPVGTMLHNAFTDRLRYIVLQSGNAHLGQWREEQRDVAADYARAFGDESPQGMAALSNLAVSADADNTQGEGLGYVADIQLLP
jgi:hypothetical protein